jgi:hypothetical protein
MRESIAWSTEKVNADSKGDWRGEGSHPLRRENMIDPIGVLSPASSMLS